jgi:hypothetical protein
VRADRGTEDLAALDVLRGLVEGEAADPCGERRGHDPLGVEAGEELRDPGVLVADQGVRGQPDVVDEERELPLGADALHVDRLVLQALGVGRDDEQGGSSAGARVPAATTRRHRGSSTRCRSAARSTQPPSRRAVVMSGVRPASAR